LHGSETQADDWPQQADEPPEFGPLSNDEPARVYSEIGPWGLIPTWVLDPDLYLAGANPATVRPGDEKPLSGAELRVYIALRSFTDKAGHSIPFVGTIAERAKVDKKTVEKAISKFKRLRWLTTRRRYRSDGSIHRCDYFIKDVCPKPDNEGYPPTGGGGVPAKSRVPHPRNGGRGTRSAAGANNTPPEHTTRTDHRSDRNGTTSARFAPSGGGVSEKKRSTTSKLNQKRDEDMELFCSLVGERLRSTGIAFTEGTYTAKQVYTGMLRFRIKRKVITFPGALLQKIHDDGGDSSLEMYLSNLGLESL
jgi:hypothetical protein